MSHHHAHQRIPSELTSALAFGLFLNLAFVVTEVCGGYYFDSLSLYGDAGHNFSDVAAIALSWIAIWVSQKKASENYTYGYKKSTILAALFNAAFLIISALVIGWEAISRLNMPESPQGLPMAIIAGIGIAINGLTAWLFVKDKRQDLNIRGVYLHMVADTVVSFGVMLAGFGVEYTGLSAIDSISSMVIAGLILYSSWKLMQDTLRLSLNAVPDHINLDKVKRVMRNANGVAGVHHVHVWGLSTSQAALTAHLVIKTEYRDKVQEVKAHVKHQLQHLGIDHATLETEFEGDICEDDCEDYD